MSAALSIVIPTRGRPGMKNTLTSILEADVDHEKIEIVVVGDTYENKFTRELEVVEELCAKAGAVYAGYDGGVHNWGHPQRNHGMRIATGDWIAFTQDDNAYTTEGIPALLADAELDEERVPKLYRIQTKWNRVVWKKPKISSGGIDADCIVLPNEPEKFPEWGVGYSADFHFIKQCLENWNSEGVFRDVIIATNQSARHVAWD
jgi:glycosyltransferase involved in cell wall biosynthesis